MGGGRHFLSWYVKSSEKSMFEIAAFGCCKSLLNDNIISLRFAAVTPTPARFLYYIDEAGQNGWWQNILIDFWLIRNLNCRIMQNYISPVS